jgi:tetratricopeptide (TPR) repeat protein
MAPNLKIRQTLLEFGCAAGIGICLTALIAAGQGDAGASLRKAGLAEYRSGHYSQAELLLKQALSAAQKANNRYEVALTYSELGDIYQGQLRLQEAEQMYRASISMLLRQPGWSHALAIVWRNLASSLIAQADYDEAMVALDRALRLVEKNKLVDPQLNAEILNSRGTIYFYKGRFGRAKVYLTRASQITLAPTEPGDLSSEDILNNLGRVYQSTGEIQKAEQTYKRALELAEMGLGASQPNLAATLTNLGTLSIDLKRYPEAEAYFQRSLRILEESGTASDEYRVMVTLHGLGKTYMKENEHVRAESVLRQAADIARRNQNHTVLIPEILRVLDDYSEVLRDLWNPTDADRLNAEAQRIRASAAFTIRARSK